MISIIIVNYNALPYLKSCIEQILNSSEKTYEIIVVDNNSSDDSVSYLRNLRDKRVNKIYNQNNLGFTTACNQGIKKAQGELLVTMNPDLLLPTNLFSRLAWHLKNNPKTLVVGPKGIGIGGPQWAGPLSYPSNIKAADRKFEHQYRHQSLRTKFIIGCLILFDHRLLNIIGFFDEKMPLGADDFDLSLRIRKAGYELRVANDVLIRHFVHASFNRSNPMECEKLANRSWDYFNQKWAHELTKYGWHRLFEDEEPVFEGEEKFYFGGI